MFLVTKGDTMKKESKLSRMIKKSGIKLCDIAGRRGVTAGAITHQMTTGIKTLKVAKQYADVLGCDPVELLD
jgi:hypothetical protein